MRFPTSTDLTIWVGAAAVLLSPIAASAQEPFSGWSRIHSGVAWDHMVSAESWATSSGDVDSLTVVRVIANRMLVRERDARVPEVVSARRADGRGVDGYERYASSTLVLEIRCTNDLVSIWEKTDFDDHGEQLDRVVYDPEWGAPSDGDFPEAMQAIVRWACSLLPAG